MKLSIFIIVLKMPQFTILEYGLILSKFQLIGLLKKPLGTKGRTSILSCRKYRASCEASLSVSRRKLHDQECCVTSLRQGGYTPLRRYAAILV